MKASIIKWLRRELILFKWFRIVFPIFKNFINSLAKQVDFFLSLIGFIAIIYFIGFNHKANTQKLNWRIPVGTATGKYRFLLIATDCPKMQIESQSVEVVKNEKERLAKKEEKREKRKEKRRKRKQ